MAKLTKKLLLSYFIIVIIMVGLGLEAIYTLSTVNQNGVDMYNDRVVPLAQIAEIAKYSENTRVQMVTAVNLEDPATTKVAEENILKIEELIKAYKESYLVPEEEAKFKEFEANWSQFTGVVANNIKLIRNGQYEEAKIGLKAGGQYFGPASENITALININKEVAYDLLNKNKQKYDESLYILIALIGLAIILAVGIGIFVGRKVAYPVIEISNRAKRIANGDLTGEDIILKNNDEIGDLAGSFNDMSKSLRGVVSTVIESSSELTAVSEQMAASSEQVSASAAEVSNSMNYVAQNTETGNQSVVEVSKVLLELSSLIQIAKGKAISAQQNSETTFQTANAGKDIVSKSINKMEIIRSRTVETEGLIQKLDQYSQEIGHITKMITSIADQTNLLALNASIEAARAGEHGRGFAVVAEEVRKLAEQSNDGASQVAELVRKISGSTGEVVKAIQENKVEVEQGVTVVASAGHALDRILTAVTITLKEVNSITDVTDEEVASSDKIVALIHKLSTIMESTASSTEEVAASTQETTAAMETVSSSAEEVSAMAQELQSSVQIFKI
ncbi:methyl-accepting chemotaxis protein [Bacillus sp. 31A1R]|uniref:Methyl-accepting chemotaxis protein n=1 Tax=Robertmurraya mangrovi TaxID=3098077 RepID=A0ABU5J428_9BACI|nr:methyl-accepting chemotaxis protein [Bacillus sp. 31A1R]MDZ5474091.1 methyl-accepting chemotaxis protein [Bacillus sp. 31A1R]